MTTEATQHLITRKQTTNCFRKRLRNRTWRPDSKIQRLSFLIKAYSTLVEVAVSLKNISLAHSTLTKRVDNRQRNSFRTVGHGVGAFLSVTFDFVGVRTKTVRGVRILG